MTMRCPNCGTKLDIQELALTDRQRSIRDAVEAIERDTGKPASTKAIADRVGYSPSTIKPDLQTMKAKEIVCLPNGRCSGWSLKKHHLRLIRAA